MRELLKFKKAELKVVQKAQETAAGLVGDFYVLAPREWESMHYEVRTLKELSPLEICDQVFAQVLCYDCIKSTGPQVIGRRDLYRICLQDHRILQAAGFGKETSRDKLALESLLLYVLTHEMVHVVRFSQQLQRLNLPLELRPQEEESVEKTTRQILLPFADRSLRHVINAFAVH